MDIKIECKSMFTLCHGCLSVDRKLTRITDQNRILFITLRNDFIQTNDDIKDLQLCWECVALLNKMKHFQTRIKTAQYRLLGCLQGLYNEDDKLRTLSLLIKSEAKIKYNHKYKFMYDDVNKQKDVLIEQNTIIEEKDPTLEQKDLTVEQKDFTLDQKDRIQEKNNEELLLEIKQENNVILIKKEYEDNFLNGNDADYLPELTFESIDSNEILKQNLKNRKKQCLRTPLKNYLQFTTVTKKNDKYPKDVSLYSETIYLTEPEVENVFRRDGKITNRLKFPFTCKGCRLGYRKRLDLLRHKSLRHRKSEYPTKCRACGHEINSDSELEDHWQFKHTPMLKCNMCGELCRSNGEVRKHLNRAHTKIFTCDRCKHEFWTLKEFSKHYKMAHERFICDYCSTSFASKKSLETHIKNNHAPKHCSICNHTYTQYRHYLNHTKTLHPHLLSLDIKKELCYCVECDKQYPSEKRYRKHLKESPRHTPKEKIRIPCPECKKIFTKKSYMKNHYRLFHLKETNYYCERCNKYFANGFGLRQHIQLVHEKVQLPKNRICDLCGRGFSSKNILDNHRRTHTGERPFKCSFCPAAFGQITAMKSHEKSQHKNDILPK